MIFSKRPIETNFEHEVTGKRNSSTFHVRIYDSHFTRFLAER